MSTLTVDEARNLVRQANEDEKQRNYDFVISQIKEQALGGRSLVVLPTRFVPEYVKRRLITDGFECKNATQFNESAYEIRWL